MVDKSLWMASQNGNTCPSPGLDISVRCHGVNGATHNITDKGTINCEDQQHERLQCTDNCGVSGK